MDVQELERRAGEALGRTLVLTAAQDPVEPSLLTPGERARLDSFPLARRREEWLRGRAALKALLGTLGLPEDTSLLSFPHPRISLTHSRGLAFAAGLPSADDGADAPLPPGAAGAVSAASGRPSIPGEPAGIGLDYEARRAPLQSGAIRFFLSEPERAQLGENPGQDDLLRLWTVKEALFKANPGNRDGDGRYLTRYVLEGAADALAGTARAPGGLALRYVSLAAGDGFLSLAVAEGPAAGPV